MKSVLIATVFAASLGFAGGPGTKTFTSKAARFSVQMPGTPQLLPNKPGKQKIDHQMSYLLKTPQGVFMVSKGEIPAKVKFNASQSKFALAMITKGAMEDRGKLIGDVEMKNTKWPTRRCVVDMPGDAFLLSQLMLVNRTLYVSIWIGAKPDSESDSVKRFFNSFKVL